MRNPVSEGRVGLVVAISLLLGAGVAVAAECFQFQLDFDLPDPGTRLKDGDQVLASTPTPEGRFVAMVTVKDQRIGEPWFMLGGKKLTPIAEPKVPVDMLPCLTGRTTAPSGPGAGWNETGVGWGGPSMAKCRTTVKCVPAVGGGGYCSARTVCGSVVGFGFSTY